MKEQLKEDIRSVLSGVIIAVLMLLAIPAMSLACWCAYKIWEMK